MPIAIRYLKISNYRSIDELELRDIPAFAVFAGANGSGKSNFFNALDFFRLVIRFDVKEALLRHGGWKNIYCVKHVEQQIDTFLFEIDTSITQLSEVSKYQLEVKQLTTDFPDVIQIVTENNTDDIRKLANHFHVEVNDVEIKNRFFIISKPNKSIEINELWKSFLNFRLYSFEPRSIKESNLAIHDDSELQRYGQNLAAVLRRLEKNDEMRETIIDWLQLIVPQLEIVQTETERLSGSAQLAFKETGTDKLFPAHLISDGTIYLLCLLVAMLDRPKMGITLIEEPERGLHPKAIMELVKGFREHATIESPIWLTTHSESVVRMLKDNELWLVDKKDGKTQINPVRNIENLQLNLDEAWLSNALNGGLPW